MTDEPAKAWAEGVKRRILIVDDDRDFVEGLVEILEPRGYEIAAAYSAHGANETIKTFEARLALLDIRLGRQSGLDLISQLRAARPGMLCVMMTAYATVESAVEALQEGAYDYLRKPSSAQELLATLERCFEKLRLEDEHRAAEALKVHNRELEHTNAQLRRLVESMQRLPANSQVSELGD